MDYRQAEKALLLGVLDALPSPTVLLNREGQAVYVNERMCSVALDKVDFAAREDVSCVLTSGLSMFQRTELGDSDGQTAMGCFEIHPVRLEGDELMGALCMFRSDPVWPENRYTALPTVSEAMCHVWERINAIADLKTPALILGEEGLGASEFARVLHEKGPKAPLDFALVTPSDDVSTLQTMAALCEGSLCCESIDRWPEDMLAEAVMLFSRRQIILEGETVVLRARLMATAGSDLPDKVQKGLFPGELYARMNIMPVFVPPLRDRTEDILPAAEQYARCFAGDLQKDIQGFGEDAGALLTEQSWPENHNELRRAVEEAVKACPGGYIRAADLAALHRPAEKAPEPTRRLRGVHDRDHVLAVLDKSGSGLEGKRRAAAELGISLATLYRILGSKGKNTGSKKKEEAL